MIFLNGCYFNFKNVTSLIADLFESFVLIQVVLASNNLDGVGGLAVTTVGSGDDGVLVVNAATTEVEATSCLEGNLVGDGVWRHFIAPDDPLIDGFAEVRITLETEWQAGSTVGLGLGHGHDKKANC
jgi:hypothetical protein